VNCESGAAAWKKKKESIPQAYKENGLRHLQLWIMDLWGSFFCFSYINLARARLFICMFNCDAHSDLNCMCQLL
jgi:hypothetical protein